MSFFSDRSLPVTQKSDRMSPVCTGVQAINRLARALYLRLPSAVALHTRPCVGVSDFPIETYVKATTGD